MPAFALFFGVGIEDFRVANIVGIDRVKVGFTIFALEFNVRINGYSFKNLAVVKERGSRRISCLLMDLPEEEPFISRFKLSKVMGAAAFFFRISIADI